MEMEWTIKPLEGPDTTRRLPLDGSVYRVGACFCWGVPDARQRLPLGHQLLSPPFAANGRRFQLRMHRPVPTEPHHWPGEQASCYDIHLHLVELRPPNGGDSSSSSSSSACTSRLPAWAAPTVGVTVVDAVSKERQMGPFVYAQRLDGWPAEQACEATPLLSAVVRDSSLQVQLQFGRLALAWDDVATLPPAAEGLGQFYGSDELADCRVVVQDDGRTFLAHRLALSAASPVFKAMFTSSSSMAEGAGSCVVVREASGDAVELLLQLMYGCRVEPRLCNLMELLRLADQYQVMRAREGVLQALAEPDVCFEPHALAHMLPQALQLGDAAAGVAAHLLGKAARCLPQLTQQPVFVQHWRLDHVLVLLRHLKRTHYSRTAKALLLAAAWANHGATGSSGGGGVGVSAADAEVAAAGAGGGCSQCSSSPCGGAGAAGGGRRAAWPVLQEELVLEHLIAADVLALHMEHPEVLQLPGLAPKLLVQLAEQNANRSAVERDAWEGAAVDAEVVRWDADGDIF